MHGYVVNLERSVSRRTHMQRELRKVTFEYEFVKAVDGRELDTSDARLFSPELVARPNFRPGAAGCALSHLNIYRKVVAEGLDYAVVMEDDIVIPKDMDRLCAEVAGHMRGAEVVLLNFHSDDGVTQVLREGSQQLSASRRLVEVADEASSTGCYMITREACERLLVGQSTLVAFPDHWVKFYQNEWIDDLWCVVPMPVPNSPELRTSIDFFRHDSFKARIREYLSEKKIPVLHQVLAMRRQRNYRKWGWAGNVEFVNESKLRSVRDSSSAEDRAPVDTLSFRRSFMRGDHMTAMLAVVSLDMESQVRQAAAGDKHAWSRLVDQYGRLIWSITTKFKLTESDAADVVQTTWMRLIEHIDRIERPDRVGSWLAVTARNECLRHVAAQKRIVLVHEDGDFDDADYREPAVDEALLAHERARDVRSAMEQLPPQWRRLLELLMSDPPFSYAEISDQLGLPVGSIGPTRGRCLAKLKVLLEAS
jgi:RNA polymerase sigma factor (sigma-70 family)